MGTETKKPRLNFPAEAPGVVALMRSFPKLVDETGIDKKLCHLIKIRSSQINGCAFCLDMHIHEAREDGISDDRLHLLTLWHDAPGFSDAERAALALTEAVTRIADAGVPDALYEEVRRHYTVQQYIGLLTTITVINTWNRFMIASGAVPPLR